MAILIVGAGGIGCELLKNLVLLGQENVEILDLDSIDATNLNRQFLFKRADVGRSKAQVAAERAMAFNPRATVVAHHANVMEPRFSKEWFTRFAVVLNALDNHEARRHVNQLCITANVRMIDSGSTGFNGQVMPVIPRLSRCFDCHPPPKQKSFPVCTIRSTPSKPEHCIAWAKYFYEMAFGPGDDDDNNVLGDLRASLADALSEQGSLGERLFQFAFDSEIRKQAELEQALEGRGPPKALALDKVLKSGGRARQQVSALSVAEKERLWSVEETAEEFLDAVSQSLGGGGARGCFDKDDPVAMRFVAAAANLRMENFYIPRISLWQAEGVAGAIVPAVASTNAMVAGLQALQAVRLLALGAEEDLEKLAAGGVKQVWVKQFPQGPFAVLPETLERPNPRCVACQIPSAVCHLRSCAEWTLRRLLEEVLRQALAFDSPQLECEGSVYLDPDMAEDSPEEYEALLDKTLQAVPIEPESALYVAEFAAEGAREIILTLVEDPSLPVENYRLAHGKLSSAANGQSAGPLPAGAAAAGAKRPAAAEDAAEEPGRKRPR